jgi:hypothetical protein
MTANAERKIALSPEVKDLAEKARAAIYDEKSLLNRSLNKRIKSGIYLLALKKVIDKSPEKADGMTFWQFFDYIGFGVSRKEAEKRISDAGKTDPEAADEVRRTANAIRHASREVRGNEDKEDQEDSEPQSVGATETQPEGPTSLLVEQAKRLISRMSRDEALELNEWLQERL